MKKHHIISSFILNIAIFFLCSCQKTETIAISSEKKAPFFSIEQAQAWYTKVFVKKSNLEKTSTIDKIKNFSPIWNDAVVSEDETYYIVECSLKFDKTPGFAIHVPSNGIDPNDIKGKTKLLILKNKKNEQIIAALMHVVSQNSSGDEITYRPKNSHFNGFIFFTDLYGIFVNGWQYQNGNTIKKSTPNQQLNINNKALPPIDGGSECNTVVTNWYERDCVEYYNGNYQCSEWIYMYSTYQTYCAGGSGSGSDDGSYTPTSGDCNTTTAAWSSGVLNASELESVSIISETSDTRIKKYVWVFAKGTFNSSLKWKSHETGVHLKNNNEWKWQSLSHDAISKEGTIIGGTLECNTNSATPTVGIYFAIMAIDYTFTWSVVCKGFPISSSENRISSKAFNVSD